MKIFIWVHGPPAVQPNELRYFNNGAMGSSGSDYAFDAPQEAFDAADLLRRRRQPYDLEMWPADRRPWLHRMSACG